MSDVPSSLTPPSDDMWNHIRRLDLCPGINNRHIYFKKVCSGLLNVNHYLNKLLESPDNGTFMQGVSLLELRIIHGIIFNEVYTFAGKLRKELVQTLGVVAAEVNQIAAEVLRANSQLEAVLQEAPSPLYAYTFYHARLMRIHPFRDGNKRTMREILVTQLRQLYGDDFGLRVSFADTQRYVDALRCSYRGNLIPLTNLVCDEMGVARVGSFAVLSNEISPLMLDDDPC